MFKLDHGSQRNITKWDNSSVTIIMNNIEGEEQSVDKLQSTRSSKPRSDLYLSLNILIYFNLYHWSYGLIF